jgi:quercetin dioxygenase-like cupin family protein
LGGTWGAEPPKGEDKWDAMNKLSLDAVAREQRKKAAAADSGRSAETVFGGHERSLRQTVIALRAGVELAEHENPGEATVQVLSGRVELRSHGGLIWSGRSGDLLAVPDDRHSLHALEDSAVLLTVVKK